VCGLKTPEENVSEEEKMDAEKVRMEADILDRVRVFTEDEWFMKTLVIVNIRSQTRDIYSTPVRERDDFLPYIRKNLYDIRPVTQVFYCNFQKRTVLYQYWTPTQWVEGMYCAATRKNVSDKIPLKTPEDFKQIPYDGVHSFHKALQGKNVIDKLIEENRSYNPRSYSGTSFAPQPHLFPFSLTPDCGSRP
jgi:hypothetical protein